MSGDRIKVIASIKLTKGYKYRENAIGSDNHKKAKEDSGIFFLEYGYQEETGRVFIVEEMESAESGKQFLAKNPNYVNEVGVDPSSLQAIVLEDWVFWPLGTRPFNLSQIYSILINYSTDRLKNNY